MGHYRTRGFIYRNMFDYEGLCRTNDNDNDLTDKYDSKIYDNPEICMTWSYVTACILM